MHLQQEPDLIQVWLFILEHPLQRARLRLSDPSPMQMLLLVRNNGLL